MTGKKREVERESKLTITTRLKREGRWEEATIFKDEVIQELREARIFGYQAKDAAWREMARAFPPLEKDEEEFVLADDEEVETLLKKLAPVDLFADIRWVYSQLENKRVRRDQAPSAGAWSLLDWARNYRSRFFEQMLPKALAKGPEDEAGVKREKRRIEEIEAMLERLKEEEHEGAQAVSDSG